MSVDLIHQAFENAITVMMALGGSTNGVLHLLALAGEAEVTMTDRDRQRDRERERERERKGEGELDKERFEYMQVSKSVVRWSKILEHP